MADIRRRLQRIAATYNGKAKKLGRPGVLTAEMLASMPGRCAYCGVSLGLADGSWDHRVPFERGGTNKISNVVRSCISCNRRKFTKSPEEFAAYEELWVTCALPGCDKRWQPRYAEHNRGMARYCSRSHSAKSRWV